MYLPTMTVYRFLTLFGLADRFKRTAIFIDSRLATGRERVFLFFMKAFWRAMTDVVLFSDLRAFVRRWPSDWSVRIFPGLCASFPGVTADGGPRRPFHRTGLPGGSELRGQYHRCRMLFRRLPPWLGQRYGGSPRASRTASGGRPWLSASSAGRAATRWGRPSSSAGCGDGVGACG